jgi:hypothetical protein
MAIATPAACASALDVEARARILDAPRRGPSGAQRASLSAPLLGSSPRRAVDGHAFSD